MSAKKLLKNNVAGLTLVEGQTTVDATAGQNVSGASQCEFSAIGDATITYASGGTDTYTVLYAGARVELHEVIFIAFTGNISFS